MTVTRTAITPPGTLPFSLANEQRFPSPLAVRPISMSRDRTTIFGAVREGGGTGLYTINDTTGATTQIATFSDRPRCLVETYDGEALCINGSVSGLGQVWRSTGWSANKAAATWESVLQLPGGNPTPEYSGNRWSMGTNGVMVVSEQGTTTTAPPSTGDNAADNATALSNNATGRARRAFVTADNGKPGSWFPLFDIMTSTLLEPRLCDGVHLHSCMYDEANDAMIIDYGDATGKGPDLFGADKMQIVISYDWRNVLTGGAATWAPLPLPADYPTTTQWVGMLCTSKGVTFGPDSVPFVLLHMPRTGYRTFGPPRVGSMFPMTNGTALLGRDLAWAGPGHPIIASFSINNGTTPSSAYLPHLYCSPDEGDTWYEIWKDSVRTRRTSDRISPFGPTVNNKMVAHTQDNGNGASANGHIITWDLVKA